MRFLTVRYRYPRGNKAAWILNPAAIARVQLILQDQGYSRLQIEEIGNGGIDVILFSDSLRAQEGFLDLRAALKYESAEVLYLNTGFVDPAATPDSEEVA